MGGVFDFFLKRGMEKEVIGGKWGRKKVGRRKGEEVQRGMQMRVSCTSEEGERNSVSLSLSLSASLTGVKGQSVLCCCWIDSISKWRIRLTTKRRKGGTRASLLVGATRGWRLNYFYVIFRVIVPYPLWPKNTLPYSGTGVWGNQNISNTILSDISECKKEKRQPKQNNA